MSSEQNKIKRYIRLDQLLRDSEGHTLKELLADPLMDYISDRTLKANLKELKEVFGAQIVKIPRGKEEVRKYKDPSFSIFQQINKDLEVIHKSIQNLAVFKGDPQYDWLRLFLIKLENGIHDSKLFMSFDNNQDLQGIDNIETLGLAILHRHPVKLKYKPFNHEAFSTNVHPYYLKQYNNRWFLIGWSEEKSALFNYPVDRICSIKHLSKPFIPTEIDFEEYFDDIVGITHIKDAKTEKVLLRVNKKSIDYIRTKPLHNTQTELKDRETADDVFLQLKVKINTELKMLLFSYSSAIEVLEPAWLRQSFAETIKEMSSMYEV